MKPVTVTGFIVAQKKGFVKPFIRKIKNHFPNKATALPMLSVTFTPSCNICVPRQCQSAADMAGSD